HDPGHPPTRSCMILETQGVLAGVLLVPSWNTPHPTSLREATVSHKGRRKGRAYRRYSFTAPVIEET
ncbi:hypothetical protein, partial [Mesorhizobium sp.]|uniref:hypothetical protein n=1 Tax=Mesorhizobium sp. TaxID=1871066 RepID=UPI00257F6EE2